jgi:hypothetical protein
VYLRCLVVSSMHSLAVATDCFLDRSFLRQQNGRSSGSLACAPPSRVGSSGIVALTAPHTTFRGAGQDYGGGTAPVFHGIPLMARQNKWQDRHARPFCLYVIQSYDVFMLPPAALLAQSCFHVPTGATSAENPEPWPGTPAGENRQYQCPASAWPAYFGTVPIPRHGR